jgi:membrane protein implicated in regulation of membrane protease activity
MSAVHHPQFMSVHNDDQYPEPGQTTVSSILPIAGFLFIAAALIAFFKIGWFVGLCGLAIAAILFALGAILDLLLEIYRSLRRLEAKADQKGDKK